MRVLIPNDAPFLRLNLPGVEFTPISKDTPLPESADGVVLWGLPRKVRQALLSLPGLQWVLTLTAGIDHLLEDLPPQVALYNAHELHDTVVAHHVAASILAVTRAIPASRDHQRERRWDRSLHLWTLQGRSVVIWGYGRIGQQVRLLLEPFGADVSGLTSRSSPAEVDAAVRRADVLVLLLPSTERTRGIVNAGVLSQLKAGAWVANYGRGELLVTADLVEELRRGRLGGAILDVTDPEPLPSDSPLWDIPNVVITPHVASTTEDLMERAARFTMEFLLRLQRGEVAPLDRSRGY